MNPTPDRRRAAILAGGTVAYTASLRAAVESCGLVIAADGGLGHAVGLGVAPDLLVGDLDSLTDTDTTRFPRMQTITYPADKTAIDSELAVDVALARGATALLLVGGTGDRWDHSLTNLTLAARLAGEGTACELTDGVSRIVMIVPALPWEGELEAGHEVGLIPLAGDAGGVTASGVEYSLQDATLLYGAGRGASNRATGGPARIACGRGVLALTLRPAPRKGR